ncbi:hypothetical protein ABZ626_38090, partial [Streptomyces longispororuber]|uniref:hypothetical protein n=1 Tax=Streptomyces longispororuber TaxID=68230 RepID=UPI0033F9560E
MITLHDAYEQGNDTVKAPVQAFGALHPTGLGRVWQRILGGFSEPEDERGEVDAGLVAIGE